jgi:purine-nucleoside phosphorylase
MSFKNEAIANLIKKTDRPPIFSILLGTGFEINENPNRILLDRISFADAGFKVRGSVEGHAYDVSLYMINTKPVLVFHGRLHLYEGYSQNEVVFPVELTYNAGISRILLTSASGGLSQDLKTGDIVVITDHINLTGGNPLLGSIQGNGRERFLDMSNIYKNPFYENVEASLKSAGIRRKKAVLAAVPGPIYETPAEANFLNTIGADVVSMSIVPEAIFAYYCGIEVTAISVVSNHHFKDKTKLSHKDIISKIGDANSDFNRFLDHLVELY